MASVDGDLDRAIMVMWRFLLWGLAILMPGLASPCTNVTIVIGLKKYKQDSFFSPYTRIIVGWVQSDLSAALAQL